MEEMEEVRIVGAVNIGCMGFIHQDAIVEEAKVEPQVKRDGKCVREKGGSTWALAVR